MPFNNIEVIRVMSWGNLHCSVPNSRSTITSAIIGIFRSVSGKGNFFANKVGIASVVRVHCYRNVPNHSFRPCSGDFYKIAAICQRKCNCPKEWFFIFVLYFYVCKTCVVLCTVINYSLTSVNKLIVPHAFECFVGGLTTDSSSVKTSLLQSENLRLKLVIVPPYLPYWRQQNQVLPV